MLPYTSAFEVSNTEETSSVGKSEDEDSSVQTPHTVPRLTPGQWLREEGPVQEDEETTVDMSSVDRFQVPEHHVISTPDGGVETPRGSQRGLPDGSPMWAKRHLEQTGNLNAIEDELIKGHLLKAPSRGKSFMSAERKTSEEEHQRFLVSGGNLHLELDTQISSTPSSPVDQSSSDEGDRPQDSSSFKVSADPVESPAYDKTLISEGDSALREAMEDNLAAEATVALDSMLNSLSSRQSAVDAAMDVDSVQDGLSDCDPAATQATTLQQGASLRVSPFYDSTSAVVNAASNNTFTLGNDSSVRSPNMMSATSPRTSESSYEQPVNHYEQRPVTQYEQTVTRYEQPATHVNRYASMNTAVIIQPPQLNASVRPLVGSPLQSLASSTHASRPLATNYNAYMSSQVSSHRASVSSHPSSYLEEDDEAEVLSKTVSPAPSPQKIQAATAMESESYTSDDAPAQATEPPAESMTHFTRPAPQPVARLEPPRYAEPISDHQPKQPTPAAVANAEARKVLRRVKRTLKESMDLQHELELLKQQRKQLLEQEEALQKEHAKLEKWNEDLEAAEAELQEAQAVPDATVEELAAEEDEIKALQEQVEALKDDVDGVRGQISNQWVDINREKQRIAQARADKLQREEERRRRKAEREAAKARFVPVMKDCGSTASYALTNTNSQIF